MKRLLSTLLLISIPLLVWADQSGTLTVDGNTDASWARGTRGTLEFSGDFGGGTITVFYLVGDTYVAFVDANGNAISYTDDGGFEFVSWGKSIRITLTGATSPDIDYQIGRIK